MPETPETPELVELVQIDFTPDEASAVAAIFFVGVTHLQPGRTLMASRPVPINDPAFASRVMSKMAALGNSVKTP